MAVLGCNRVGLEIPSYGQRDQSYITGISGAGIGSQGAGHQRVIGSTMVPNPLNSLHKKLSFMGGTQIPSRKKGSAEFSKGVGRPGIQSQSQGARPKGTKPFPIKTATGNQWMLANFTLSFFNC